MKTYNKLKIAILIFISLLLTGVAMGQAVSKVGTSAASFLKIQVGARAAALGGAFVSVADDPSALYWNPGGLARVDRPSLIVDHSIWILPTLQHNFIGMSLPIEGFGTIGLSLISLATDEMEITTVDRPEGTGEKFDGQLTAIAFSYGRYLTDFFSIGASVKIINERIYNSEATGFAIDIGTVYDTPLPGLKLGFNISNFGTKMSIQGEDLNIPADIAGNQQGNNDEIVARLKTEEFDLPLIMQVGLSYEALAIDDNKLVVMMDGVNPSDNVQSVNTGAELSMFNNLVVLRGGYNEMFLKDREKGLTLGAGFNTPVDSYFDLNIAYAFQSFEHLPDVNRFTLILKF